LQYGGVVGGGASQVNGFAAINPSIDPPLMGGTNAGPDTSFSINEMSAVGTFIHDVRRGATSGPGGNKYGDYAAHLQLGEGTPYHIGTLYVDSAADGDTFAFSFLANPGYLKIISGNTAGAAASVSAESYPVYVGRGDSVLFSTVPEPGTLALLATGLMGLVVYAWRKRK